MPFVIHGDDLDANRGRSRRHRSRRRKLWAGLIGAVLGWGIAGLDGGVAGTSAVPRPTVDFKVTGSVTATGSGTLPFDLASNSRFVRQVLMVENGRLDMVFDREAGTIAIVDAEAVVVRRHELAAEGLFEPFAHTESIADGPLEIFKDGIGSHLGHACERFRATGTADGLPVAVTACFTPEGIPLTAEMIGAGPSIRTELTSLEVGEPDPTHFAIPSDRTVIDLTGG